jgi:glycosyltransferase involved in cell wall biosynthesis
VFYARPGTPRRGFELGMMALDLFARQHPEVEIHLVGQPIFWHRPSFPFVDHGFLPPTELAALYRRCSAALVLSLTNLSLLPAELLACGCTPVMNDAENTRVSCDSPYVRFTRPVPTEIAATLARLVECPPTVDERQAAARSVQSQSWDDVGDQVEAGFRRAFELARSR